MALARRGEREGFWLRAERQNSGRGRQGRAWDSPTGNLFASTIVTLRPDDPPPASLALVASLALLETVRAFLPDDHKAEAVLKWPNDLLLGGAKLSGILLEREGAAIVVGIGVNLASHPEGLGRPVASLAAYTMPPGADIFLIDLSERFAQCLARWRQNGLIAMRDEWLGHAHPIGSSLTVHDPSGTRIEGQFDGLTEDGALRLRLADGSVHVMHAGDVFLI